jgi:hypothetical protein
MKTLYSLVAVVGFLAAPNVFAAFDGTIKVSGSPYTLGTPGSGGEFTATAAGFGTFQSFCLEANEYIDFGNTFDYNKNTGAVQGGVSGATTIDSHTGLPMDNISIGTVYLYSHFADGSLTGYHFAGNPQRVADATDLQNAIWWLEGEGGARNHWVDLAESNLGGLNDTDIKKDALGNPLNTFNVIALNLFNGSDAQHVTIGGVTYNLNQDILAISVVPEPTTIVAGALLLLPFGASTLRILRKNNQT